MLKFSCPDCNLAFSKRDELAGQTMECPQCRKRFTIPDMGGKPKHQPQRSSRTRGPATQQAPTKGFSAATVVGASAVLLIVLVLGGWGVSILIRPDASKETVVGANGSEKTVPDVETPKQNTVPKKNESDPGTAKQKTDFDKKDKGSDPTLDLEKKKEPKKKPAADQLNGKDKKDPLKIGEDPLKLRILVLIAILKDGIPEEKAKAFDELSKLTERKSPQARHAITLLISLQDKGRPALPILQRHLRNCKADFERAVSVELESKQGDSDARQRLCDAIEHYLVCLSQISLNDLDTVQLAIDFALMPREFYLRHVNPQTGLPSTCNAPLKLDHQKAILVVRQNQ